MVMLESGCSNKNIGECYRNPRNPVYAAGLVLDSPQAKCYETCGPFRFCDYRLVVERIVDLEGTDRPLRENW